MDSVIGLKAIDGKFAFLGYVESISLNDSANDTRTDFSLSDDELDEILDFAKAKCNYPPPERLAQGIMVLRIAR
jgi:hypothetical protein